VGDTCKVAQLQSRGPVIDILIWVECYASMVSVLSTHFADKAPQFMAYLRAMVRAQWTSAGEGWVTYESRLPSPWNGELSTSLSTTKPLQAVPSFRFCLSELHSSENCSYAPFGVLWH